MINASHDSIGSRRMDPAVTRIVDESPHQPDTMSRIQFAPRTPFSNASSVRIFSLPGGSILTRNAYNTYNQVLKPWFPTLGLWGFGAGAGALLVRSNRLFSSISLLTASTVSVCNPTCPL